MKKPQPRLLSDAELRPLSDRETRLFSDPEPYPFSDPELRPLNDPEPHLLSDPGPRSSIIQSRILKSASFHKPEGRVPFIKLKNRGLHFSQTIQSRVLSKG